MTDRNDRTRDTDMPGNARKDPEDWITGDEPMTGAQRSYLKTLCEEAHEPIDETLTKAQAAQRIDELQQKTGRGVNTRGSAGRGFADAADNTLKDPEEWTTGDEPMTGAQRAYLQTLCAEADEPLDEALTKAEASKRIDELQQKTGRGIAPQERRR